MNGILPSLRGWRTHLTVLVAVVLIVGDTSGWWKVPAELLAALMFAAISFLRAALDRGPSQPSHIAPATQTGAEVFSPATELPNPHS